MNEFTYMRHTASAEATKQLAAALAPYLRAGDVVAFSGDLGAGKTQFVQGAAEALGITAQVTSPTFNILLQYEGGRLPLYHYDLYRLENPDQLEDVAFYETIEGDGVTFIEWSEKFPDEMPDDYLAVAVSADTSGVRTVRVGACGVRSNELLRMWASDEAAQLAKV